MVPKSKHAGRSSLLCYHASEIFSWIVFIHSGKLRITTTNRMNYFRIVRGGGRSYGTTN